MSPAPNVHLISRQDREHPRRVAAPAAISVSGLAYSVRKRSGETLAILDNINLTVADGEFVAIVGPSGCGKSTLLNFLARLLPVQSGRVEVFGSSTGPVKGTVGYMFQQHALFPWRTVLRNTELGLEIQGSNRLERRQRCLDILEQLGLQGFADHYPSQVSGGMRQRISLARTLVGNPRIVLMDEPFGALDAQTKMLVQELFLAFWEKHRRTVLFITHDLDEAIALSDRVIVMSARPGRVLSEYTIDLPRPRNLDALRTSTRLLQYRKQLWEDLRDEAMKVLRDKP
jgi:NitT/TauT family transport system ATP-binding protein